MQFTTAILAAALAATGAQAAPWTKSGQGVWVANNNFHQVNYKGQEIRAHEACTWQGQPVARDPGTKCTYWTNGQGGQFHGNCLYFQMGNKKEMNCAAI